MHAITLKWRVLALVITTLVVLTWLMLYDEAGLRTGLQPPPNFLGSTWYGPLLLLLIPLSLGWLSFAAQARSFTRRAGLTFTVLVFLICLLLIWVCMSAVGSLPFGLPPYGGPVQ